MESSLKGLDQVVSLNVSKAQLVELGGIQHLTNQLAHSTSIIELFLAWLGIGAQGAKFLAEAIKLNCSLRVISLGGNNIRDEGVEYLAEAIRVNSTLQVIFLGSNAIAGANGAQYCRGYQGQFYDPKDCT
jgi:Ran GTPase-activating protein (RanGAP) involved in mRNA processing and transport